MSALSIVSYANSFRSCDSKNRIRILKQTRVRNEFSQLLPSILFPYKDTITTHEPCKSHIDQLRQKHIHGKAQVRRSRHKQCVSKGKSNGLASERLRNERNGISIEWRTRRNFEETNRTVWLINVSNHRVIPLFLAETNAKL